MIDLIETRKTLESWGDEVLSSMRDILIKNDKNASGNLIKSLKYNITYLNENLDIEFEMPEYGEYVDKGRRPGKQPPIASIQQWLSIKGIPQSAAFPIARKIGSEGIKATPFFDSTINSKIQKLVLDLTTAYTKDLENYYKKQIDNNF